MLPLGILTAVVSAIRVCGSPSLRAFVGRAQESPGSAELELLSCTSSTTCELWNEGGIARVFGKPQVLEVVRIEAESSDYFESEEDPHGHAGVLLFDEIIEGRREGGIWRQVKAADSMSDLSSKVLQVLRKLRLIRRNWTDDRSMPMSKENLALASKETSEVQICL